MSQFILTCFCLQLKPKWILAFQSNKKINKRQSFVSIQSRTSSLSTFYLLMHILQIFILLRFSVAHFSLSCWLFVCCTYVCLSLTLLNIYDIDEDIRGGPFVLQTHWDKKQPFEFLNSTKGTSTCPWSRIHCFFVFLSFCLFIVLHLFWFFGESFGWPKNI